MRVHLLIKQVYTFERDWRSVRDKNTPYFTRRKSTRQNSYGVQEDRSVDSEKARASPAFAR